jgi:stage V sporulation protein B
MSGGAPMSRGKAMLKNTILLTGTSLLMRTVGISFQVYLTKKIGASGIGLFQLIMSVSMLAATFAISGIRFATTRLVSEELGKGNTGGVKKVVIRCLVYALSFGTAAMLALYFNAEMIGTKWIGDSRTVLSLRILSLSLPAFALSHVLSGYFTAVCRVIKSAAVNIGEQLIRIAVVITALSASAEYSVENACAFIVAGGVAGEVFSFTLLYVLYVFDRRRYAARAATEHGMTKRMFGIALPLAFSAYARTSLATLENLLVPKGFRKSGATADAALADYGVIEGMVIPIITFPSAFFYSLAELVVPELTQAQVNGRKDDISAMVNRILRYCLLFSIGAATVMFQFSTELGLCIYSSAKVGHYIGLLSLLLPFMYLDSITDGMLRGLGQQMYSMKYNIMDSFITVILVYTLLPKFAVLGYIFIIYFTELFNFTLSIHRLHVIAQIRFSLAVIMKSVLSAFGSVNFSVFLLRHAGLPLSPATFVLIAHIVLTVILYMALLLLLGCLDRREIDWLITHLDIKRKSRPNKVKT